jgi:ubiquinone/menaquinone biosynthesis C-methylase UbiE
MSASPEKPLPLEGVKTIQQQSWAAGDFSLVGAAATLAGELLCEAVALHAGERVLDVATGSGNTALAAARRGALVTGVDYVPALLERARERVEAERFKHVEFKLGDTENLPFPSGSFDVVLSTFGHMFAPDPDRAASEMARVCRPGGRIGFAAWTPDGFTGRTFAINGKYNPPPPGLAAPLLWGTEDAVRARFRDTAAGFSFVRRNHNFRAVSAEQWLTLMRKYFGPMKLAFEKLDEAGCEAYSRDLLQLVEESNQSGDETVFIPGEYLEAVIRRKE